MCPAKLYQGEDFDSKIRIVHALHEFQLCKIRLALIRVSSSHRRVSNDSIGLVCIEESVPW